MKLQKMLLGCAITLSLFTSISYAKEGQTVYVCLAGGFGSCKATVLREGSEKTKVQWLESCKTKSSFLGLGGFKEGNQEWVTKSAVKSHSYHCE
jgi:hypothetical protein